MSCSAVSLRARSIFGSTLGAAILLLSLAGSRPAEAQVQNLNTLNNYPTIQAAVSAASANDVLSVSPGTYNENVTINLDLTLISTGGRAVTTIEGIADGSLGTIRVTGGTTGVQIGDVGQGFTIIGIDNGNPAIENAAIYFQGGHSGAQILDNEIVANGDGGLLTEYGATISNFLIDGNTFSGQTFVGAGPDGNGFSDQFSAPNRPRQLVVMGCGGGCTSTSNVTFSNNMVTGTAGGYNPAVEEQGNTLVTLDGDGVIVTGNTFAGTTTRFATSLRVRGPSTTVSGNSFVSTGIQAPLAATGHVFFQNTGQAAATIAAANTFDRGVYVDGTVGTLGWSIQSAVLAVSGGTTIEVLPGTYEEQIICDGKDVTLHGADRNTTIIASPATLAVTFTTTGPNKPVVTGANTPGFVIRNFTIDGQGAGNANNRFSGVAFWNAGGAVLDCDVIAIRDTPASGVQHGIGIYSFNNTGGPYALEVGNCTVTDYQKNAMALSGETMVVDVHDCTTVGAGDIAYTAQNGIQVSYGAAGTVTDCDISAVRYTPATFVASGLLTYLCGGPVVTSGNVVISDCQAPVSWYDTDGTLGGLEIASGGEFDAVFLYNDTVVRSAERPLPVPFEESMPTGRAPVTFAVAVTDGCLTGSAVALSSGIDIYSASSALNVVVTNMTITNWDYGIYMYGAGATCVANDNSIAGNLTAGFDNSASGNPVDAERNWWGAADGPSGAGSGSGDAVNDTGFPGSVDFDPYRIDGSSTTVCAFTPVDNTVSPNPSPLDCISGPTPCVTVPFEIMRTDSDGMRGYSVNFTLSPELELCSGLSSVVQGSYLNSINPLTAFQVLDNGGGSYTVDCSILGIPCGQTAPTGTLFTVGVKASGGDGTGTITVDSVIARDCANVPIPCSPGAPASILIDATGPVAVGDLAAMQKTTGNTAGNDTTGIFVNFTEPGDADVVEVWAAPYGNYPEYDDAPGAGSVPAIPSYPPSAPWILTSATTTGDTVHLAARDFWYFTMFTKDECGNVSAVSNMTSGTLNYHLGDVTDGSTNGHGDNGVGFLDVSLLGANYGITLGVSDPLGYLDVGPTSDFSVNGLPDTDNQVQFEDLMMFAINYGLVSAPARAPQPSEAVLTEPFVSMTYRHENGHTFATLRLEDNVSQVKGVHALLDGGGAAVISATPTGIAQPGSVFLGTIPQESGTFVDLAVLGTDAVFAGSGEIAVVELDGLVRPAIRTVDLRNRANRSPNHPRTEEPDAADDGTTDAVTDVQVSSVQLVGARPNPFDGSTRIAFRLPAATPVTVRIHDVAGRLVRTLVDRPVAAGETSVVWDGRSDDGRVVGAGIYFYTLTAAEHRETRKLLRVR